jgi:hypothetical protein
MRDRPNLPQDPAKSNEASHLLDAVIEIGNRRRLLLLKMKEAVRKRDRDAVFQCAEELVGLSELGTEEETSRCQKK